MPAPLMRLGYYPEDDDYYVILDVDFRASQETIASAYKNLARQFHPDKHNQDERSRKEAEMIFLKIKTAYDVLSDPHKRAIYDALGPDGLKQDGWTIVSKQMTAQELREEFLRLQKQSADTLIAQEAQPKASFTMALDASHLFRTKDEHNGNDDDDDDYDLNDTYYGWIYNNLASIEIRSLSTSMSVDNEIALRHGLTIGGELSTKNGTGDGTFASTYRYNYRPGTQLTLNCTLGRTPFYSVGLNHRLTAKTYVSCRGSLIVDTLILAPIFSLTLKHQIRDCLMGKVSYKESLSSAVTTSLIYVNKDLMIDVTTSYKLSHLEQRLSVDVSYKFNHEDSKLSVSLVGSSNDGLAVAYGCQTTVFKINTIGASISLSLPAGVTLKLCYSRAHQEFNLPIYLSDEIHSGPLFYGTMLPLVAYYVVDRFYLKKHKPIK